MKGEGRFVATVEPREVAEGRVDRRQLWVIWSAARYHGPQCFLHVSLGIIERASDVEALARSVEAHLKAFFGEI